MRWWVGVRLFFPFVFAGSLFAENQLPLLPPAKVLEQAYVHNLSHHVTDSCRRVLEQLEEPVPIPLIRPFAEFERTRYLLTSAYFHYGSEEAKRAIASHLPDGVTLVVLVESEEEIADTREYFIKLVPSPSRLKIIRANAGFWVRDSLPIPAFQNFKNSFKLALGEARYYHQSRPGSQIAQAFQAPLSSHEYYFEGGNFLVDDKGNLFLVDNERSRLISDEIFKTVYGCKNIVRLPKVGGIGHIDERVKFVTSIDVVTDTEQYREIFEKLGYRVTLLPRAEKSFETYANSLLVNGLLFLPIFGEATDQEAIRIYESFQLKVVPLKVDELPNKGMGSIHCITMTYPDVPFDIF
jgi:agmatine/peptidylarginine deiminase